jgi:F-type H+-transporting ATPase subunit h
LDRAIADPHSPLADPVQDLYLRELKAYKPTPLKANDADEHVHESQEVEVEGQAAAGEAAPVEESWFEEEEEAPAAH